MSVESTISQKPIALPATMHIQPLQPIPIANTRDIKYAWPQTNRSPSISSSASDDEEEEDNDDDLSLEIIADRSSTPPTPCSSVCHDKFMYTSSCDSYLQYIEPNPVLPPSYDTLPPGGCPRFPVSAPSIFPYSAEISCENNDLQPPAYKPAIYKIGVVARKMEWINPNELSPHRSWKYYIIELNSTQLNFYNVPAKYEHQLVTFSPDSLTSQQPFQNYDTNLNSLFTCSADHQFYDMVKKMGLIERNSGCSKKGKCLVRSYSLQNSKIGLATDYKKRANVLRMKLEDEQMLLNFGNVDELITWNLLLNVGKDVALDLTDREFPKYRTVPRRRRRNRNTEGNGSSSLLSAIHPNGSLARLRSVSDPNKFRGRFSRLKSKLSSAKLSTYNNRQVVEPAAMYLNNSLPRSIYYIQLPTPVSTPSSESIVATTRSNSVSDFRNVSTAESSETEPHDDDDEEEEEDDGEFDQASVNSATNVHVEESPSYCYKWNPEKKFDKHKYHRDCLRCIKPLLYN